MTEYIDQYDMIRKMRPLIVVGMHRSGTSLIVRLLREIGFFMGGRLSRDAESIYFQKINRRIYKSVEANWGMIDPLITAMNSQSFINEHIKQVRNDLFSKRSLLRTNIETYFGPYDWELITNNDFMHWGWKDPRTTLTLPIWMQIFPNARVLHMVRNGIDVAISLHQRSKKQKRKIWKQIIRLDYCPEALDFEFCFRLWEKYLSFFLGIKEAIRSDNFMEIRYEKLISEPETQLRMICDFLSYPVQGKILTQAIKQIDQNRLDNSLLAAKYQYIIPDLLESTMMQRFQYSY